MYHIMSLVCYSILPLVLTCGTRVAKLDNTLLTVAYGSALGKLEGFPYFRTLKMAGKILNSDDKTNSAGKDTTAVEMTDQGMLNLTD